MSAQCQACSAPSPDAFICRQCTTDLRDMLRALTQGPYIPAVNGRTASGGKWMIERRTAGLLANLDDVVHRHTRIGGSNGHRKRGDEISVPFEPHTGKMVKDKKTGDDTDEPVLSPQGNAALLLDTINNKLTTIVRDVCESRGIQCPRGDVHTAAAYLVANINAMVCDESAGQWHHEIQGYVRRIEQAIDRPTRFEMLGFCTTETGEKACGTTLRAPEDAIEVRCPKCHTVRRCDIVRRMAQSDARRELITWKQVLEVNKRQPEDWRVNERTLRHWRASGALKAKKSLDDEELYKWDDIEQLRSKVPARERKRTRAGA